MVVELTFDIAYLPDFAYNEGNKGTLEVVPIKIEFRNPLTLGQQ